jgi:predicted RNase H-like nuclease (RuvC/YqgF family)
LFQFLDIANRDNEIQKLNGDVSRVKDILQRQTIDMEQLKQQINEQRQNNHVEENNKIEIRNLQNALDSSKKELEAQKALITDYKKKLDDLNKQLEMKPPAPKSGGDSFLVIISRHYVLLFL